MSMKRPRPAAPGELTGTFVSVSARLRSAFERNFSLGREVGAAVSVWQHGREIVSVCGGFRDATREMPWEPETIVLIWSATKGMAAACALHVIEHAGLGLETRVAEIWPDFAHGGKEKITIGQVLSHSAGLGALDRMDLSVMDHEGVVRAIEEQVSFPEAVGGPGYGPRTFGFLVDEIVRRIDGTSLGRYWRREFGDPLGLDLWIGLPEAEHPRTATILPARTGAGNSAFLEAMNRSDSLTHKAFSSPAGLLAVSAMNSPDARSASLPSMGGIGSARSLAKFYAMLAAGGRWNGVSYFGERAFGWASNRLSQGFDKILRIETSFSAGFMMNPAGDPTNRALLGPSPRAFGHPGAGGSLGFADPDSGIGFGYVMNQMEPGVLPGERAQALLRALYPPGT